jgi:hypothetical protein
MPKRHLRVLEDAVFNGAFQQAIEAAVKAVSGEDKDCRVLNLGSGAGLHAMMALRAGAHHVTAVERWLYLALTTQECLEANKVRVQQGVMSGGMRGYGDGGGGRYVPLGGGLRPGRTAATAGADTFSDPVLSAAVASPRMG